MQIHPSPYLLSNLVFQPIIAYLVLTQAVFRVEYGSLILLINQWEANPSADACKEALFNRLFCDEHAAQKRRIIKA